MKLSVEGKLRLAVQLAFLAGVGAAANGAYADDATAPATTDKTVQVGAVKVTGSRIKQPDLTSSSPLLTISDEEFKLQGTVNVETLLNNLPQTFAGFGTADSNGATGTATVDLRGLGPQETLVLIDGKRLMPGDPIQSPPSADLNFIPAALIDSVDIITGGASAVYGSDAVAGVVNFNLKKDFQGFRIDAEATRTDHSDGTTYNPTLVWGQNFAGGKGNVTLFASYTKQEAVTEDKRKFSECAFNTQVTRDASLNVTGDKHVCAGSGTIPDGRIYTYGKKYGGPGGYGLIDPAGSRSIVADDGRTFNFAPYNYIQRPSSRYNFGGFAHDEINSHLDVYGSAMFMENHTVAQVAPSGLFFNSETVPCNNPLLSAQEVDYLCNNAGGPGPNGAATFLVAKRTTEVGPRDDDLRHTDYRIVIGAKGDISDGWTYDVSGQRGQVLYNHQYLGYTDNTKIQNALNATPDGNGGVQCGPLGSAPDPKCVPLDLFAVGKITPAQAAYITGFGETTATQVEQVLTGTATGDLGKYGLKSPMAVNGVGLALGSEYRTESLDYRPDNSIATGTLGGLGGPSPAISGGFQVTEAFGELQVPVLENLPFAKLFQVGAAYRWGNYSLANDAHSYKGDLKFSPTNDVTLRASYQRATRAPSVSELFAPVAAGLVGGSDPCSGTAPSLSLAQCQRTGVTALQYGGIANCSAGQCNGQFAGNQALKPELSITRSVGFVITPTFVKNFSLTVDYFDIRIGGPIGVVPFNSILQDCAINGTASSCNAIHRGPAGRLFGGSLAQGYVDEPNLNTGFERTKGFDTALNYSLRMRDLGLGNSGRLIFSYNATYLFDFTAESSTGSGNFAGSGVYECVGRYGLTCGTPNPRYRHKFRTTYDITPIGLTLSADWRYFGDVELDANSDDPNLKASVVNNLPTDPPGTPKSTHDSSEGKFGAKQYLDLSGSYVLPTKDRNVTLRFGISNVGGQAPPLANQTIAAPPFGNGNTFPAVYDALGRVMFVGVTADF